jgi:outer membrane protein assembly factor BamE (lipoprotein component of BamABCDE complex)
MHRTSERERRVSGTGTLRAARPIGIAAGIVLGLMVAGCSTTVTKHGHYFRDSDIQQIQPGMSQEQVRQSLGTPTTTASAGTGDAFYYISNTSSQTAFFAEKEIDRQIVAVYFTRVGSVERVAQYGMKDGKIFDFISRTTPSANTRDQGLLKELFRNLGRVGNIFGE